LDVLHHDPGYIADTLETLILLAGTSYGHPADGTTAAIERLQSQDLRAFHNRYYSPEGAVLAVVGDIAPEAAFREADHYFGGWKPLPAQPASADSKPQPAESAPRIVIVDKPDAVQTEIRVGNSGIPRSSPDYLALMVANQILGGPASNRLFSDLRGEHGLTYSASSDLDCYLTAGTWVAKTSTRTPETARAVHRVLDEMRRMRDHGISGAELQQAVNYLIGHQALDFETSSGIADQFLDLMNYHLSLDTWSNQPAALRALTPDDVSQVARRYLDPDRATIVLVGNASDFEKDMKKLGSVRLIPIDSLDLSAPGFQTVPPAGHAR
jgi:zinc protease